jgi:hypothetical protein
MIKLTNKDFQDLTQRDRYEFPTYSKPILNIATQNSQATRVKYVGSMKEQFSDFLKRPGEKGVKEWEDYYYDHCDGRNKIEASAQRVLEMINKMPLDRSVFNFDLCRMYIEDLAINKTHYGMSGEYYSVLAVAKYFNLPHRFSNAEEESQGIDAFIGQYPAQVKPHDSVMMHHVYNHADQDKTLVITYEEKKNTCYIHNPDFIINK